MNKFAFYMAYSDPRAALEILCACSTGPADSLEKVASTLDKEAFMDAVGDYASKVWNSGLGRRAIMGLGGAALGGGAGYLMGGKQGALIGAGIGGVGGVMAGGASLMGQKGAAPAVSGGAQGVQGGGDIASQALAKDNTNTKVTIEDNAAGNDGMPMTDAGVGYGPKVGGGNAGNVVQAGGAAPQGQVTQGTVNRAKPINLGFTGTSKQPADMPGLSLAPGQGRNFSDWYGNQFPRK
jgi:hypothetical protein